MGVENLNYDAILSQIESRVDAPWKDLFEFVVEKLAGIDRYNWVGIYVVRKGKLVLDSYRGEKTEHEVITVGAGLCGLAITEDAVINERDVKGNALYLSCFPSTKSELVVPIRHGGKPIGEIDVDSDTINAFTREDENFLEKVSSMIGEKVFSRFEE